MRVWEPVGLFYFFCFICFAEKPFSSPKQKRAKHNDYVRKLVPNPSALAYFKSELETDPWYLGRQFAVRHDAMTVNKLKVLQSKKKKKKFFKWDSIFVVQDLTIFDLFKKKH